MRILHLDSGPEMRGGQWQVLYLLRGLRARGHEVKLLARGPLLETASAEGFDAMPLKLTAVGGWPEIVHAHDARSHAFAVLRRAAPAVVSRRVAFDIHTGPLSGWKYRRAQRYIAISQHVASKLFDAGIKSDAISVVYDGVPLPPRWGVAPRGVVLAPASGDPMKASDLAREAARLAGVAIEFSTDLPRDLARAGLFVCLSRSEGLGSSALLAMAHGVPVVASRAGGLVEAVEDGVTGILTPNEPVEIARAIRRLSDDDELRRRMARAARERVERLFTVDSMVEGTIRVYQKVRE